MDNLEKQIRDGQQLEAMQKEPVFQEALQRARDAAYQLFLKAETDDARRTAQARAFAVDALEEEMRVTIGRGISAKVEVERNRRPPNRR